MLKVNNTFPYIVVKIYHFVILLWFRFSTPRRGDGDLVGTEGLQVVSTPQGT